MGFRGLPGGIRISSALAVLAGLGIATYLFVATGPAVVIGLLVDAGYGVAVVIAFHIVQILFDSLAWRALLGTAGRPRLHLFMVLRWIREATNNLLPVAQIGGEVVGARLLSLFGVGMAKAGASTAIDLTLEMLSQVGFTVFGIAVLMSFGPRFAPLWQAATGALIALSAVGLGFVAAQWAGLFRLIEEGLLRVGSRFGWRSLDEVAGLHRAIIEIWRMPGALLACGTLHLVSWLLGGVEVMLACHYLGHDVSLQQGIVLESLGQAMKSVGFAIPGGLGVQEGGLLLLAPLCGLPAGDAMALSLLKRLREMVLGVPALIAVHLMAGCAGVPTSAVQGIARRP
jgi:putative membrane protein